MVVRKNGMLFYIISEDISDKVTVTNLNGFRW